MEEKEVVQNSASLKYEAEKQRIKNKVKSMKKEKLRDIIKRAFSLTGDTADYEVIEERILSGGEVKGTNLSILVLAALIASIGLNMNSTAVIIGAMLISPLMGGIMAIAYGLATADLKQARNSFIGLGIQVVACLLIAAIYFFLSPVKSPTDELIARTAPTIWDVMIACFGGLAGIIGTTRKEKSNVLPGVAIATALMPPLCTAGYGIASGNLAYFLGAFYLFLLNTYFICFSSVIVLLLLNIPKRSNEFDKINLKKIKNRVIRITIILIIPSIFFAYQMVRQEMEVTGQTVQIESGQFVDMERLTRELQVIHPQIQSVELQMTQGYDRQEGQHDTTTVVVISPDEINEKEKELIRQLVELEVESPTMLWQNGVE